MKWDPALEDVHMNIEARLTEIVRRRWAASCTPAARATIRSRPICACGRVARPTSIGDAIDGSVRRLVDRAEEQSATLMPGYTHLQRAQPVRLAHHLLAWFEMLRRDRGRVRRRARARMNESPLGAGAIAGTTFRIDRDEVARELGFDRPMAQLAWTRRRAAIS